MRTRAHVVFSSMWEFIHMSGTKSDQTIAAEDAAASSAVADAAQEAADAAAGTDS